MTAQLDRGIAELKKKFAAEIASKDIWHLGTTNCRRKNNTATGPWSEHAWPNAVDVMIANNSRRRAVGDRVAAWMRSRPDLWSEVFWQVAAHYDHVHGTANPRMNFDNKQVPPCAGGPGNGDGDDLAILTDAEQLELKRWLSRLDDMNSNISYISSLIPDIRKNIVTMDELNARLAALPAAPTVDATARSMARKALDTLLRIKEVIQ